MNWSPRTRSSLHPPAPSAEATRSSSRSPPAPVQRFSRTTRSRSSTARTRGCSTKVDSSAASQCHTSAGCSCRVHRCAVPRRVEQSRRRRTRRAARRPSTTRRAVAQATPTTRSTRSLSMTRTWPATLRRVVRPRVADARATTMHVAWTCRSRCRSHSRHPTSHRETRVRRTTSQPTRMPRPTCTRHRSDGRVAAASQAPRSLVRPSPCSIESSMKPIHIKGFATSTRSVPFSRSSLIGSPPTARTQRPTTSRCTYRRKHSVIHHQHALATY